VQGVGRSKEEGGDYREGTRVGDETGLLHVSAGLEEKVIYLSSLLNFYSFIKI
jgi:hypothetical protein